MESTPHPLAGRRVLVLGGAGFLGHHVVRLLLDVDAHVKVLDNLSTGTMGNLLGLRGLAPGDVHVCDVVAECSEIITSWRPEVVVHLAAQVSLTASRDRPDLDASTNIVGTIKVIDACVRAQVTHLVFASSCAVYGVPSQLPVPVLAPMRPLTPYGISKAAAQNYLDWALRERGLTYTSLVFGNLYGPGQGEHCGVVASLIRAALTGEPMRIVGSGRQTRDFVYVEDAARAVLWACLQDERPGPVNAGTGEGTSIVELAELVNLGLGGGVPVAFEVGDWGVPAMRLEADGPLRPSALAPRWREVFSTSLPLGLVKTIEAERLGKQAPLPIG